MKKRALAAASVVLSLLPVGALAQADADSRATRVFVAQRLWAANWDTPLLDARIVVPDPANPAPVIQMASIQTPAEMKVLPITVLGASRGNFTASASVSPSTSFGLEDAAGGSVSRQEYDLSIGYRIAPGLLASLIYKGGKTSEVTTQAASTLVGARGDQKLRGVLVGFTASAPLAERLSLYGNAAYGRGRSTITFNSPTVPDSKNDLDYTIAEVGLAYSLGAPSAVPAVNSISLQVGYRSQIVAVRGVELATYSATPTPQQLAVNKRKIQSNTHGLVIGLIVLF
jgi:hypothetical protein